MNELSQQYIFSLSLVWIAVFTLMYGLGGMNGKWKRRFLGTAWMMAGIVLYSVMLKTWHWAYLSFWPLAVMACSLGYGGDEIVPRLRKRALQGAAFSVTPIALVIYNNAWWAWAFHILICMATTLIVGGFNVFGNARKNETTVAALCFLLVLFLTSKP